MPDPIETPAADHVADVPADKPVAGKIPAAPEGEEKRPGGEQDPAPKSGADSLLGDDGEKLLEGDKPEDKPAADKPDVPETYEFKAPEGVTLDSAAIEGFTPIAKELGLSQDQAQKLVDFYASRSAEAEQANATALKEYNAALIKRVKEDPDIGGAALAQNLGKAKAAITKFGTPELQRLLVESGFGNEPDVLKFLVRIGDFDSEDKLVRGGANRPIPAKGDLTSLYNSEIMPERT